MAVENIERYELVENSSQYFEFIRTLRNHPQLKRGFVKQNEISILEHSEYMMKNASNYFVCLVSGKPAGYIGVVDDDIRLAVDPLYQNIGVGKFMVKEIIKKYPNAHAKVKRENNVSMNLFKSLKFTEEFVVFTQENATKQYE